jgi:hypothetical protein
MRKNVLPPEIKNHLKTNKMNEFKACMVEVLKKGYVCIPLELFKWWILRERKLTEFEAFIMMISLVNFRDNEVSVSGGRAICRRGESIRSIKRWSEEFRWEIDETLLFFGRLRKKGVLEYIEYPISKNHIRIAEYERLTGKEVSVATHRSGGKGRVQSLRDLGEKEVPVAARLQEVKGRVRRARIKKAVPV